MEAILDGIEKVFSAPGRAVSAYTSWDNLKQVVFLNMVVFIGLLVGTLALDWVINAFYSAGVLLISHQPGPHPYSFGNGQILAALFFGWQAWHHVNLWRYVK